MSSIRSYIIALVVLLGISVTAAHALLIQSGYEGSNYGPYQSGNGGEFTLTVLDGVLDLSGYSDLTSGFGGGDSFQSFCVEMTAYINRYPSTMDAVINTAVSSGVPGAPLDPLSQGTGWLYSQFASAAWSDGLSYDYTNPGRSDGTGSSAYLLQQAIWMLEDELAPVSGNIFYDAAIAEFADQGGAKSGSATDFGVYALNLTRADDGKASQDQIYYKGASEVPDGGLTIAMLGAALAGLAYAGRRVRGI